MSEGRTSVTTKSYGDRIVLLVCAVAFALALSGAWLRPVWHDELYTLALARLPLTELVSALVVDSGPPLHYVLCHLLYMVVGWQEGSFLGTLMVRLPSVLAFAVLPWVVWRNRPAGRIGGPWGPLLVVAWLPLLYFGTEARVYALLALVNALMWIRGAEWIESGSLGGVKFGLLAACLPLLHYTGAASFLALPALALFISPERRRRLLMIVTAASLPTLAWLPVMLASPSASMGWLATGSGPGRPGLATISVLAPAGPFPALFEVSRAPLPSWASIAILAGLIGGAVIGAHRLQRTVGRYRPELRSATRLGFGVLPAAALAVAALTGVPLYFAGRTESMVWALVAALVAILLLGLPPLARRVAAGAYVVAGAATVVMWAVDLPSRPLAPGIEVGRELASRIDEGDRVVVVGLWQLEVRHGLAEGSLARKNPFLIEVEAIPRSQAEHPGWLDQDAAASPALLDEARALREDADEKQSRIWLVWSPGLPLEENFFPAFAGWKRGPVARSSLISADLLVPGHVDMDARQGQPEGDDVVF